MKKSFVLMTVIVATLAFVGLVLAQNCGPMPCAPEQLYVTGKMPFKGMWMKPKPGKPTPPKCIPAKGCMPPCLIPGGPYAIGPTLAPMEFKRTVDVLRDLCVGKAKGKCKLCGPCAPTIAWSGSWKTSEIIGKTDVSVVLPPAYRWCDAEGCPTGPIGVKAVPKPAPAPECF
jgi:hypothetical protein